MSISSGFPSFSRVVQQPPPQAMTPMTTLAACFEKQATLTSSGGARAMHFPQRSGSGSSSTDDVIDSGKQTPACMSSAFSSNSSSNSCASSTYSNGSRSEGSASPTLVGQYKGTMDYLTDLLRDKTTMEYLLFYMPVNLTRVMALLDSEIDKVRSDLLKTLTNMDIPPIELPEPVGEVITVTKKVFFPKKEFPDFNFTGRILGPRGATIKRPEKEIGPGCTLAIRGKGSDPKNEMFRPNKEEQHVLVTIKETPNRAQLLMEYALRKIQPFLVPKEEENDPLKIAQMIELAILKGNYRDGPAFNPQQMLIEMMSRLTVAAQSVPLYSVPTTTSAAATNPWCQYRAPVSTAVGASSASAVAGSTPSFGSAFFPYGSLTSAAPGAP